MSIDQDIASSAKQLEADVKINHQITHGGDTVEVPTEGGPVPSIRKRLKDIETEWSKTADPLADSLASTVQVTKGYKDAAAASATDAAAEVPKVQAEGSKQIKAVTDQGTATIDQVKTEGGKQTAAATSQANRASNEADAAAGSAGDASTYADSASDSANLAAASKEAAATSATQAQASATAASDSATESGEHVLNVAAIADKFGNVNQAITEATEQANRATTSADEAKGHAQSADNANTSAVNAKEQAKTAAVEAKEAEANATAIVHNDEGSVTSKPGAYPVADSKGHLDIGWTPLLAASWPYSGVIGSVDKGDLFYFGQTEDWANYIRILGRQFNIAGRFVNIEGYFSFQLPEAESTAARAVAFDDIFLDWSGNIQTYRSITPHRTVTGYDRDAIATEHGYTKVQTGLYEIGGVYALLLGRVARRNQGAFHPVFNKQGTSVRLKDTGIYRPYAWWWKDGFRLVSDTDDCFDFAVKGDPYPYEHGIVLEVGDGGNIAQGVDYCGIPGGRFFDAIYADDFTFLGYSAKNVIDRQALLFDNFNRAVAGETFSGAEGASITQARATYAEQVGNSTTGWIFRVELDRDIISAVGSAHSVDSLNVYLTTATINQRINYIFDDGLIDMYVESLSLAVGDLVYITESSGKVMPFKSDSARPQFLMVDIIGAQNVMPAEWLTEGIPGNWLAVDEEGESLIPDGTAKNYKMSRKALEAYQVLRTADAGVTWTDVTATYKASIEGTGNTMGSQSFTASEVFMVFYRTSADPFELADSMARLSLSTTAGYSSNNEFNNGSVIVSNLINKIPTSTLTAQVGLTQIGAEITNNAIDGLITTNPSGKYLPYLSGEDNFFMSMYYKEMKHNGTSWGDDNKFQIVNNQSTVTDLNGESVIVGQKRVELPYQFDGEQY